MAICPAGHQTSQRDFCDICGLPVPAPAAATIPASPELSAPAVAEPVVCPNCKTLNVADALFCEACGYDFTTGTLPVPAAAPVATPAEGLVAAPTGEQEAGHPEADGAEPVHAEPPAEVEAATIAPAPVTRKRPVVEWVAELWIDPDWYAAQGSSDPMPSPSLPDIVPLVKEINLVGRVSHSRGIFPDVDCDLDTGCSRKHAKLTTDGSRWWIEDLDSANGTFVGAVSGPLPGMPIPQGRVEVNPGQRIYVGAWTRIVIRRATEDEKEAFAA